MKGLYSPQVGDRVAFNHGPLRKGTVQKVVLEDARHSGSVEVLWDGDGAPTKVHRRTLHRTR